MSGDTQPGCGDCDARRAILQAARSRFMHYGFKKTTIDEIAADAGIGKGSVYLHFSSKEDILLTIARELKRSVTEQMRAIASSMAKPEEKLRRMMLAKIIMVHDAAFSSTHGLDIVDDILRPKVMQCGMSEMETQKQIIADVLIDGERIGEFSLQGRNPAEAAELFTMAYMSFFPPYLTGCYAEKAHCQKRLEVMVSAMTEFLLNGLRRR
ncbi:MAG: TetR/AcrR family transcriptional regulator [Proteobacteria bacterium]|nr:MAG: TetR/AcrR family transcriptional regulator [Pseudomonadota bacterium]